MATIKFIGQNKPKSVTTVAEGNVSSSSIRRDGDGIRISFYNQDVGSRDGKHRVWVSLSNDEIVTLFEEVIRKSERNKIRITLDRDDLVRHAKRFIIPQTRKSH